MRELGLQVRDPLELGASTTSWLETIMHWIVEADYVIADISRQNPNVLYEVGYAHALGKSTILLVDGTADANIPAALAGYLFLTYDPGDLGSLHRGLTKWLLRMLKRREG